MNESRAIDIRINNIGHLGNLAQDVYPNNPGIDLQFQVCDVQKPLLAVRRLTECGNEVRFGPGEKDNYIMNPKDGKKIQLIKRGYGLYMMAVHMPGTGMTEITIDSGAEDSVCPWDWGQQFGLMPPSQAMNLFDAQGNLIKHHGVRNVFVQSPF